MRISFLKEQIHNSIIIDSEVLYVRHLNGKPMLAIRVWYRGACRGFGRSPKETKHEGMNE
jgi:hypothetical protein